MPGSDGVRTASPPDEPPAGATWAQRHQRIADFLGRAFPALRLLTDDEAARLMAIGAAIGVFGGFAAGVLDRALVLTGDLLLGTDEPGRHAPLWYLALVGPVIGALIAAAALRFGSRHHRPQGIPDVVAAIDGDGSVSLREALASAVAAVALIGGGQSGGREGPTVQLSAGVASRLCRSLGIPPKRARILVAAGAAAGIAASFNTPIGAAFFALEIILGNFAMRMFGPVVAASVMGTVVGQWLLGDRVAIHGPTFSLKSPVELLFYAFLGAVCGVVATVFKRGLVATNHFVDHLKLPMTARLVVPGVIVGIMGALGFHQVMGNGYGFMELLLAGDAGLSVELLALVLVLKMAATMVTASGRGGVGIFAPCLAIGAITGSIFGGLLHGAWPHLTEASGAYALVGMGAVTAAVTHAPITLVLMLFEMTGNYQVILPLLLALSVAGVVSAALRSESLYTIELKERGLYHERREGQMVLYDVKVADLMREGEVETIRPDAPFSELAERFLKQRVQEVFVVDAEGRYHGVVDLLDIRGLLREHQHDLKVCDVECRTVVTLRPEQSIAAVLPLFFRADMDELPVLDAEQHLLGILRDRDVIGAYDREILRHDALLARVEGGDEDNPQTDYFELPPGQVMSSIEVTGQLVGRTLAELRLPRRFRSTVLAVVSVDPVTGRSVRFAAEAGLRLKLGDRIVVVGPREDVERLAGEDAERESTQERPR